MKVLFISLGCDKNLADSEEMLGLLTGKGHEIVDSEEEAEVIVINTCCFIHDAKEESVENILEMAEYKKAGTCKVLIVTGCMAQRYKEEIIQEIPEVDAVLGTTSYMDILKAIDEACEGRHFQEFRDINELPEDSGRRVLTRRPLWLSEDCRRLRQTLYLLHYSFSQGKIPQCSSGAADRSGRAYGGTGGKRTDSRCSGNYHVRHGSLRKKDASSSYERAL